MFMGTWRFDFRDQHRAEEELQGGKPIIMALWHNRLGTSMAIYQRWFSRIPGQPRLAAIISASKDGGMLSEVVRHFGLEPIRGSSSRRGRQAMLEATSWLEKGGSLAITPDGPRGPRYEVREGVIGLAQFTGVPIIPVIANSRSKWTLKSWDAFQVPKPWTTITVNFGEKMRVPREANEEEREALRLELGRRLSALVED
jgi:hypothetical protein